MLRLKREATLDDLERLPEGRRGEIVDGRIVLLPLAGCAHSRTSSFIVARLMEYEARTGWGYAFADAGAFAVELPHRRSFCPDVAFHRGPLSGPDFMKGAPIFAGEIRSKTEYGLKAERARAAKRAEYFSAGTLVVWDIEVLREGWVRSYRAEAPHEPSVFAVGELAHAEPALPRWTMSVEDMMNHVRGLG